MKLQKEYGHPITEELKKLVKDVGIEDQILIHRLKKIQEERPLCRRYRRKMIKVGPLITEERSVTEIKKKKVKIKIRKSIMEVMDEFSKMLMTLIMKSEDSVEL